eukprot:tig00000142_g8658.t1
MLAASAPPAEHAPGAPSGGMRDALEPIRELFRRAAGGMEALSTDAHWAAFVDLLQQHGKILESDRVDLLKLWTGRKPREMFTWNVFLELLMHRYNRDYSKACARLLGDCLERAQDVADMVHAWKIEQMDEATAEQVLALVQGIRNAGGDIHAAISDGGKAPGQQRLEDEENRLFFWDRLRPAADEEQKRGDGPSSVLPPDPFAYQRRHAAEIDAEFGRYQVREAFYRDRDKKPVVLAEMEHGMQRVAGSATDSGIKVEILRVPRVGVPYHVSCAVFRTFDAHRQLALSPRVPRYLGSDDVTDPSAVLFFTEHLPASRSLAALLRRGGPIPEDQILFRFWARELLRALDDLLGRCTLTLQRPVGPASVWISGGGWRLTLRNLAWGPERPGRNAPGMGPEGQLFARQMEGALLRQFADLLVSMLSGVVPKRPGAPAPAPQPGSGWRGPGPARLRPRRRRRAQLLPAALGLPRAPAHVYGLWAGEEEEDEEWEGEAARRWPTKAGAAAPAASANRLAARAAEEAKKVTEAGRRKEAAAAERAARARPELPGIGELGVSPVLAHILRACRGEAGGAVTAADLLRHPFFGDFPEFTETVVQRELADYLAAADDISRAF